MTKKKRIIIVLLNLFLSLFLGCGKTQENISLETLFSELVGCGFEQQKIIIWDKEQLDGMANSISQQLGLNVSVKDMEKSMSEQFPVGRIVAVYKKTNRTVVIMMDEFKSKKAAKKEIERRVKKSEDVLLGLHSFTRTLKEIKINENTAYYQVFGSSSTEKYETKVFWSKGMYMFEVTSRGDIWAEEEAVTIAEKIKY